MPNNVLEQESIRTETKEVREQTEGAKDESFEQVAKGAEILENPPPDGSFVHGLQLFVAWVNSLVSGAKKDD